MKAKELMIGDWVHNNHHGKNIKITQYDFFTHIHNECGEQEFAPYAKPISGRDFEPIPLTPEILEKNGFVANKRVYPYPYYEYINKGNKLEIGFAFPQGNRTSYKEPWVYIDSERVFVEHLPCVFVHQLQHALRLCGIEKEIEL